MKIILTFLILFIRFRNIRSTVTKEVIYDDEPIQSDVPEQMLKEFFNIFEIKHGHLKRKNVTILPSQANSKNYIVYKSLSRHFGDKIVENMEKIIEMQVEINRVKYKYLISNVSESIKGKTLQIEGKKSCSLDDQGTDELKSVCPWHNRILFRPNIYPHKRVFAQCNCVKCLIQTLYDNKRILFSSCEPVFTLMPALFKIGDEWEFRMEPVSTSCQCTVRFKVF